MTETVILCFRDLVTAPGDTVALHAKKIDALGHCWWGWWKKPIENVPVDLFRKLYNGDRENLNEKIFLYDCGARENEQYKVYRATLSALRVAPAQVSMSSPQMDATPDYYIHVKCAAWWRLTDIEEVSDVPSLLRTMTYRSFPSWPSSSEHQRFVGREVTDCAELDRMRVTLWHVETSNATVNA
ncbi:MAG: hypothetical protein DHS20C21_00600 [Gemmatimonadota bacterium]|nr:MAG: hypothetical protein DHS20C21_00600 [Gemmatimonadota bacterium]